MVDYYELLEISRNASKEVIEKAYKALIKKYHPDIAPAGLKEEYEEKLKEINLAYEVIIDESKRAEYDNKLREYESYNNMQNRNVINDTRNNVVNENVVQPNVNEQVQHNMDNVYTEEDYQREIDNIKKSYDKYIDDFAKSVYGEGNYYYVDDRPFKEKFKDFCVEAYRRLKVIVVFTLIMLIVFAIAFSNEEFRTSILSGLEPIIDFISRVINNIKQNLNS